MKLFDFISTLFASFGSTPKERDSDDGRFWVDVEVEEQYRDNFIDVAMHDGTYEDIREAYELYRCHRDTECLF